MGSSSFSLPNVERALSEMEVGIGGTNNAADPRRLATGRPPGGGGRPTPLNATAPNTGRPLTSPTPAVSSPSPTGGQTQHEVLQDFFNRLLSNKDRQGASSAAGRTNPKATNGSTANEEGSS